MQQHRPQVAIVIVSYNGRANTLLTLDSVLQSDYPHFKVLLVDNGSIDGTIDAVSEQFPTVEIMRSETNLGFAGGYNLGMERVLGNDADAILILNNDVMVAADMLSRLVAVIGDSVGAAGPVIYYESRPDVVWSSGFRRHPVTLEPVAGLRGRTLPRNIKEPYLVDYLLGCGILFSRQALLAAGLFDTRYFLYYEDLDLCLRLQACGLSLTSVPNARMWHKVAASTGLDSPCRTYHMARSSVLFFTKHATPLQAPIIFGWRSGSALRKLAGLVARRQGLALRAYLAGLRDGWSGSSNDAGYCQPKGAA